MGERNPTAIVSWAHTSQGWTPEQDNEWRQQVMALVDGLRDNGIDADIDLHHQGDVDWTRFGPGAIVDKEWVLVALSPSWKQRWEGTNEPTVGAGAAGEANALRSVWVENQNAFKNKLVLLTLPMMGKARLVPLELHGVEHFSITDFTAQGLEQLLRLLTNQPAYPPRPLGSVPRLPPEARLPDVGAAPSAPDVVLPSAEGVPGVSVQPREQASEFARDYSEAGRRGNQEAERHSAPIFKSQPTADAILNAAPKPEGSPAHWMLYDGMLLIRFAAGPAPSHAPKLQGRAALERLADASTAALEWVKGNLRPSAPGLLHQVLASEWRPARAKHWVAGRSTDSPQEMIERATVGVVVTTDPPMLAADFTIPTTVTRAGQPPYQAAHEPRIAADLLTLIVLASNVFTEAQLIDFAVLLSAAPKDQPLVSAESYAPYPFDEPHDGISARGPFPDHWWSERARARLDDLDRGPWDAARQLLDDWLVTFRQTDLFDEIRITPQDTSSMR